MTDPNHKHPRDARKDIHLGKQPLKEGVNLGAFESTPLSGKTLAEKTKAAFDAKKIEPSFSSFKSLQSIMIEHARLMSWL